MAKNDRLSRTASVAYTKGLLNNPGENNCFLNSAVQVLWHLDVFRRSFREISGHFCVGESCIFCALKVIFTQIQYSDEAALPPDALRQALAVTFKDQQRFQLQDMDDAAECLENILNRLHFHFAMNEKDEICSAAHCISHRKFAMEIMEQSICNCGATSEPLPFSQLVHYVSVSALCHEADVLRSKFKDINQDMFGYLLKRAVNQGDVRACPGINCGKKISVQQSLLNCPDVVCVGLIWDSECPDVEQITQLLDCIDPVLRLPEVFPRVVDDTAKRVHLLLAGIVTYYGKHYSTFFYSNKLNTWIYFDDARVRKCGSEWETIRKKCCQNHYQPLLLLYVNPHGRSVDTTNAPSEVRLVDTKTLLASQENSRTRSFSNEKTNDRSGGTLSVLREHRPAGDTADGLLSSSSSHSLGSDQGLEKDVEVTTPERKKSKRSMKILRGIGSDIKRALSRSRNNSPTPEDNSTGALHPENVEKVNGRKKNASCDDLIDLSDNPGAKMTRSSYGSASTRGHEIDEVDSGLGSGSSQASSPATSSVSSVDTSTDDLIDFSSRSFPRPSKANDSQQRVESLVEEGESLLRRSQDLEKQDLALSLSLSIEAATRFRIALDNFPRNQSQTFYARLKERHRLCFERSRNLHNLIKKRDNYAATTLEFSQQEKQKLINNQKERDEQVLREMKQTPTLQGTLPRSHLKDRVPVNEVIPMSSRSINDLYLSSNVPESSAPFISRRTRSFHSGSVGKSCGDEFHDDVNCTQKIKPDSLCYSPVHYGKANGVINGFERLNLAQESRDRNPTVAHVQTSFIPVGSLGMDQMLPTSTVLPNSRNWRNDIRRCSVYDNMPPSGDPKLNSNVPPRTLLSPSHTNYRSRGPATAEAGENRKSLTSPVYVDPPPYDFSRAPHPGSKNQSGSLLERFHVPVTSRHSEPVGMPEDVRRMNEGIRNSHRVCMQCHKTLVEKNATFCRPCQQLNFMLYDLKDNSAMHY